MATDAKPEVFGVLVGASELFIEHHPQPVLLGGDEVVVGRTVAQRVGVQVPLVQVRHIGSSECHHVGRARTPFAERLRLGTMQVAVVQVPACAHLTPETQPCTAQVSSKHCRILRPTCKEMVEQHAALVRAHDTAPSCGLCGLPSPQHSLTSRLLRRRGLTGPCLLTSLTTRAPTGRG